MKRRICMNMFITIVGVTGFVVCLFIMYGTKHGIPGIRKYDTDFRLLDMRFRYNSEDVYRTFERITSEGRSAYRTYLMLDYCFIVFFLIVMLAISYKISSSNGVKYLLIGSSLSRALLDVAENTILINLLGKHSDPSPLLANICSWCTTFKFISLYIWIIVIAFVFLKNYL